MVRNMDDSPYGMGEVGKDRTLRYLLAYRETGTGNRSDLTIYYEK